MILVLALFSVVLNSFKPVTAVIFIRNILLRVQ